jgi:aspartyl-tRNA(Asn)/glutamyl-tRNA(Gln) amidotransferase subunit A
VSDAIHQWTARQTRQAIRGKETSATEVAQALLARIARLDGRDAPGGGLGAFLHVDPARVLARAAALDAEHATAADRPLFGVPVAVKDNLCTRDVPTTAASRMLERFVPPFTAPAVERLEAAGAIVLGKTNCDEFAMGSSTENSAFGVTRNPWDLERIPGGSSGGSAAAVAAGLVPLALGSDTGGSIRQPAALCGVTGLKPTYGRVPRYGLIAFASSLDQIGPIASTVEDAALAFSVLAGHDPHDATSVAASVPDLSAASTSLRGVRVGVPRALMSEGVEPGVLAAVDDALKVLEAQGAVLQTIDLPHSRHGIAAYYLIATAEASSNLARYDGVRYGVRAANEGKTVASMYESTRGTGFGAEVKRRIMLGTYALSAGYYDAYYGKALKVRRLIAEDFARAYEDADVLLTPTAPTVAFPLGAKTDSPLAMYLCDVYTMPSPLAGHPAMSIPFGTGEGGLPIGVQLVGPRGGDARLLRTARWLIARVAAEQIR